MSRRLPNAYLVAVCAVIGFLSIKTLAEMKSKCQYWRSKVDATVTSPEKTPEADVTDPQIVLAGIECLLKIEGNKHPAKFSGAVNDEVSQIFPRATADVAALYYISFLYYQKWEHANAIALRGPDGEVNKSDDIREAYRSYRKWFEQVKRVGLAKARELKLEPLKDTKVHWY